MANRDLIGRMLGEYELREPIGEGGGGLIYRCRQSTLDRDLVIKILRNPKRDDSMAADRFKREAKLASRLRHHYATHIYDFGVEHDGLRWIAMELVRGETFQHWLQHHGPMPLEQFVPFFERVVEVVHEAHKLDIIHRDIKPSNIMVVEDHNGILVPKLLDFGIAKGTLGPPGQWADGSLAENVEPAPPPSAGGPVTVTDPGLDDVRLTPMGVAIGSKPYMSPEQLYDSASVGPAADIYSLGVFAHQALYGTLPPESQSYPPGRLPLPKAPIDRILARALAYWPKDRYATALAFAADFRAALESSEREQLRTSARQWDIGDRAPGLLWGIDMLARFERWTAQSSWRALDPVELAFIAQSHRRARSTLRTRRTIIGLASTALVALLGSLVIYLAMSTSLAHEKAAAAEQLVTQAEVEQGRQSLRDNAAEAKTHLATAYRRGDHSDGTKFMLARALQSDRAQLAHLPGRGGRMWSTRFSPSGDLIVTTDEKFAQLWDTKSYQLRFTLPHADTVYDAVFSHDGKMLYTACGNGTIGVWDVASGAPRRVFNTLGNSPRYYLLTLSPDERMIAAIDIDGATVSVWDTINGTQLAALSNDGMGFPSLAFTANSQWLASTGGEEARIFDVHAWKQTFSVPHVRRLAASPTTPSVALSSLNGDIAIWDIPGSQRAHHLREVGAAAERLAFSPDGKLLASASPGQSEIWDTQTGKLEGQIAGRRSKVYSLEFDHDARLLLSSYGDGSAVISDVALRVAAATFESDDGVADRARFSADSRTVVVASRSGHATVWQARASYLRWGLPPLEGNCTDSDAPDRRFIALACPGVPTRILDTEQGTLVAELPIVNSFKADWFPVVASVSSSGDVAAIAQGRDVGIYELPNKRLQTTIHHGATVTFVSFDHSNHDLVTGDSDGVLMITKDGHPPELLNHMTGGVDLLEVLSDKVVATSTDHQLFVFDRVTHAILAKLDTGTRIGAMSVSSDGASMATRPSFQQTAVVTPTLWSLTQYKSIAQLVGHHGNVFSVQAVESGAAFITTGDDATVRRWDAHTGKLLQTYRGSPVFLMNAGSTPDGSLVVGAASDGTIWIWEGQTGRQLWIIRSPPALFSTLQLTRRNITTIDPHGGILSWGLPPSDAVIEEVLGPDTFSK